MRIPEIGAIGGKMGDVITIDAQAKSINDLLEMLYVMEMDEQTVSDVVGSAAY